MEITIRTAELDDLPRLTEISNHYIVHTHITFDIHPFAPDERLPWFKEHNDGRRYRLLVAHSPERGVVGFAATGRFRPKEAYDTTVEVSVACSPDATGHGVGTRLYEALFAAIQHEDIYRIVGGIAQPNAASNALHARFGFKPVGIFSSVGRKFGRYWDVMWVERSLR